MEKEKVIIIGSGGHAKVVLDILQLNEHVKIVGFSSNSLPVNSEFNGYSVLGNDEDLHRLYKEGKFSKLAMGVGGFRDNSLRKKLFLQFKNDGFSFINIIHPQSIISSSCKLGESVMIFPGVIINTNVIIGNNTIIATGSSIDHETQIGNHVLVSAGVTVGANVNIGDETLLALGSKVISAISIGSNCLVAAGGVCVNNIANGLIVFGVPAKEKNK